MNEEMQEAVLAGLDPEAIARDTLAFVEVTSETGAEGEGSLFLADLLKREGFDVDLDEVETGRPNVYAKVPGSDRSAPALLFNGHTDTIPVGESTPPGREGDRMRMVERQLLARDITDPRVVRAMRRVPRERFVPPDQRQRAYEDRPLPIGANVFPFLKLGTWDPK